MNLTRRLCNCKTSAAVMQGFSLIEMMISLTIGLLILAGVGYAYIGTKQNFRSQDVSARMQESARIAFETMSRDIRMAGFIGCPTSALPYVNNNLPNPGYWFQNISQPSSGVPTSTLSLIGYENTAETSIGSNSSFMPISAGFNPNGDFNVTAIQGDVLSIVHADPDQQYQVTSGAGAVPVTLNTTPNPLNTTPASGFQSGQILLGIIDCNNTDVVGKGVDLMQVNTPKNNTFKYNTGNSYISSALYSTVYALSAATYFIQTNADGEPALYRQRLQTNGATLAEELVEGVQDMQISYAMGNNDGTKLVADASGNNYAACYVIPDATGNLKDCGGTTRVLNWSFVVGVRISLLMVSRSSEGNITTVARAYQLDRNGDGNVTDGGEIVTPTDNLLRKVFTTTIAVKNRL